MTDIQIGPDGLVTNATFTWTPGDAAPKFLAFDLGVKTDGFVVPGNFAAPESENGPTALSVMQYATALVGDLTIDTIAKTETRKPYEFAFRVSNGDLKALADVIDVKTAKRPDLVWFDEVTHTHWKTTPSEPAADIKKAAECMRNAQKNRDTQIAEAIAKQKESDAVVDPDPADAVKIKGAEHVSLRPFEYKLDKVEVHTTQGFDNYFAIGPCIRVHFTVPDRKTGKPLSLHYRQTIDMALVAKDPTYLPEMIRNTMRLAYMHELDETLFFKGRRFTEPHPEFVGYDFATGVKPPDLIRANERDARDLAEKRRIEQEARQR